MCEPGAPGAPESQALLADFGDFLAANLGLHFRPDQWRELEHRMRDVACAFGHADAASCMRWLMHACLTRTQVEVLAAHLTNGETYFLRESPSLAALAGHILPELIARRRTECRLRIWCAGCSTGEEAYSVAIVLDTLQEPLRDWAVSILATDINPEALRKAAQARYGEWSFRGVPADIQARYFRRTSGGRFELLPRIREKVTFAYLNLAEDAFPSLATGTNAIDVILCRNVLMYFTPDSAQRVLERFHRALGDGGWLIPGAAETPQLPLRLPAWQAYRPGDCTIFRKAGADESAVAGGTPASVKRSRNAARPPKPRAAPAARPAGAEAQAASAGGLLEDARALYAQGRYAAAAALLETARAGPGCARSAALLARCHANAGNLAAALACSRNALAANKLDPATHYVHALIETEAGDPAQAERSLRRTLYLDGDFVPAHIALATLAARRGKGALARKHLDIALALLARQAPEDLVPETDGMSAGGLARTVQSMRELTHADA